MFGKFGTCGGFQPIESYVFITRERTTDYVVGFAHSFKYIASQPGAGWRRQGFGGFFFSGKQGCGLLSDFTCRGEFGFVGAKEQSWDYSGEG